MIAAAVLVLPAAAACRAGSTPAAKASSAHGRLYAMSRALRIGVKNDQPGLSLADPTGTEYTGLDIDIAGAVATALHDKPVFQALVSNTRESMLLSGAVDLVVASYSISEERLKVIDFAGPYLIAGQAILVRADDKSIIGVDSLKDKITCGTVGSNSPARLAVKFGGSEDAKNPWGRTHLRLDAGYSECLQDLLNKKADAVSTDDSILAGYANSPKYRGRVRLLPERFTTHREYYGIGIAKGDHADIALINATLRQMIKDGRWEKIVRKNLGATAQQFLRPESRPSPPS
ncbi:MAG TPA: transporter substrate-binding domain-containing protein [Streptosporangiaceae bacterium]